MNKLLSCRFNMDTNRVEARFKDGTILSIDCIAIEDEYGNTPAQRAELDWLLYNKPLEYAQLVLGGEIEHYLFLGCDHGRLEVRPSPCSILFFQRIRHSTNRTCTSWSAGLLLRIHF